jgi:hypothetical protein
MVLLAGTTGWLAGCSTSTEDDAGSSPNDVTAAGDTSKVLKSTLLLKQGCTATKIGPKHLLVAARCVANNPAFAAGKALEYTVASTGGNSVAPSTAKDSGAPPADPTTDDDAGAADPDTTDDDAGAPPTADAGSADAGKTNTSGKGVTIADVQIHPSFTAKCKTATSCGFDTLAAGDAPDIAVIILSDELATVPTLPVDLDAVGEGDPLLVVASNCARVDANVKSTSSPKTMKVVAVPADAAAHKGGPYEKNTALVPHLAGGYVVTAGSDWKSTAPKICAGDIGAPVFRATSAAIVGVTSNFTARSVDKPVPVTVEHTRVDETSRFKIGTWLSDMGAMTVHSCSESENGCPKNSYDAGLPDNQGKTGDTTGPSDGGKADVLAPDADAPATDPNGNIDQQLPPDEGEGQDGEGSLGTSGGEGDEFADAAVPSKKKKKSTGGCTTAPGSAPDYGLVVGLGLAIAVVSRRRKR